MGSETRSCPKCGATLTALTYPGGSLNEDQWATIRAGDWYCTSLATDHGQHAERGSRGFAYFWDSEVCGTLRPAPQPEACASCADLRAKLDDALDTLDLAQQEAPRVESDIRADERGGWRARVEGLKREMMPHADWYVKAAIQAHNAALDAVLALDSLPAREPDTAPTFAHDADCVIRGGEQVCSCPPLPAREGEGA